MYTPKSWFEKYSALFELLKAYQRRHSLPEGFDPSVNNIFDDITVALHHPHSVTYKSLKEVVDQAGILSEKKGILFEEQHVDLLKHAQFCILRILLEQAESRILVSNTHEALRAVDEYCILLLSYSKGFDVLGVSFNLPLFSEKQTHSFFLETFHDGMSTVFLNTRCVPELRRRIYAAFKMLGMERNSSKNILSYHSRWSHISLLGAGDTIVAEPSISSSWMLSRSVVHFAALLNAVELLDTLLRQGWCPNLRDSEGNAPLHLAAAAGHETIVDHLLRHPNIDRTAKNKLGNIPSVLAVLAKNDVCFQLLLGCDNPDDIVIATPPEGPNLFAGRRRSDSLTAFAKKNPNSRIAAIIREATPSPISPRSSLGSIGE